MGRYMEVFMILIFKHFLLDPFEKEVKLSTFSKASEVEYGSVNEP